MTKLFCDKCEAELPFTHGDVHVDATWSLRVRVGRSGSTRDCDLCKPCLASLLADGAKTLEGQTLEFLCEKSPQEVRSPQEEPEPEELLEVAARALADWWTASTGYTDLEASARAFLVHDAHLEDGEGCPAMLAPHSGSDLKAKHDELVRDVEAERDALQYPGAWDTRSDSAERIAVVAHGTQVAGRLDAILKKARGEK